MASFTGQLRSNEIFAALYNMIISQQVFADNLAGVPSLVDQARVDGGLYGDTKLFYATDVLKSVAWGNDAEAANLLALHRPAAPEVQAIILDQFRQISLTVDDYLSKRAWGDEGAFGAFNSVMMGWIGETKRVYDGTLYNAYIGTAISAEGKQTVSVPVAAAVSGLSGEEAARVEAQVIAKSVADLLVEMEDVSRDYNDYANLRSFAEGDIKVVWNSKWLNKITKLDLPTIHHPEGVMDKFKEKLPSRYFGKVITASNVAGYSASTPTAGKPIDSDDKTYTPGTGNVNGTIRSLVERDIKVDTVVYHVFPGDELPAGAVIDSVSAATKIIYGECYIEDATIIAKVLVKLPPYMSAFEVGTSFFNPKSLTENHYLTFGHNTIEYLKNYPFVTVIKG